MGYIRHPTRSPENRESEFTIKCSRCGKEELRFWTLFRPSQCTACERSGFLNIVTILISIILLTSLLTLSFCWAGEDKETLPDFKNWWAITPRLIDLNQDKEPDLIMLTFLALSGGPTEVINLYEAAAIKFSFLVYYKGSQKSYWLKRKEGWINVPKEKYKKEQDKFYIKIGTTRKDLVMEFLN